MCRFSNTGDDWYVLVGVAKDLILNPRSVAGGFVYTYKLVNNGEKLEFLHKVGTSHWFSWILGPTGLSHLLLKLWVRSSGDHIGSQIDYVPSVSGTQKMLGLSCSSEALLPGSPTGGLRANQPQW